jgi:HNH endonuclease
MWQLFDEHWKKKESRYRYHWCESCSAMIWGENRTIYHHHLLPKGTSRYHHLKYEIDNLMLLCWNCHSNTEAGKSSAEVIRRTQQAKELFGVG